jgi:hypothetical protein
LDPIDSVGRLGPAEHQASVAGGRNLSFESFDRSSGVWREVCRKSRYCFEQNETSLVSRGSMRRGEREDAAPRSVITLISKKGIILITAHGWRKVPIGLVCGLRWLFITAIVLAVSILTLDAQVSVTTWHNDIARTGQNLSETVLTPSNVNATQFGKLFSQTVDGFVYAQPLYLPAVTIAGASHNVVFVATQHDSVYAFDADSNGGADAHPLWFASLLTTAHGATAGATAVPSADLGTDIVPEVGITGTPVIDPSTGTLYVVSKTLEGGLFIQRLHALDVTSGAEKFGGPAIITATVSGTGNGSSGGTIVFDSEWENQRPGLLLLNGIVYIGFAAHGDNGPWHGWILGYNAATLAQTGVFCSSPNGTGSGFWMSGAGLAADQLNPTTQPYGRMFVPTGNGDYNATKPYTNSMDFGDSDLNLNLANGAPIITDEFTPYLQSQDDAEDGDVASGGLVVLPTQTTGSVPHLAVQSGKNGWLYLLNRDNMGGYSTTTDNIVQEITWAVGETGVWSTPAYWNGNVYYWGVNDSLKSFALTNGQLSTNPTKSSEGYGFPGSTPSISANGATQGIVWSVDSEAYSTPGPAILQAHNASNVADTLYSSRTNLTRDNPGPAVKFTVPTIVNGKVYVGAQYQVSVFGLLNQEPQAAAPVLSPGVETFSGSLAVRMSDATSGATIYYTLNGSTPTTSSSVYTGPITITATTTIQAIASGSGYLQSAVTSGTYTDQSQASMPTFNPAGGTITAPISVTIANGTPGATIYYTTNGTTPTSSSTKYSGPMSVDVTETLNAIAVAPGFLSSAVASATYTLNSGQTGISFPVGFAGTQGVMILNGSAGLNDSRLQLTDGAVNEAGSAWYYQPVNVQAFTTSFSFQLSNPVGNGITFAIQGNNTAALGSDASGLGYRGIAKSLAIKFDFSTPVGSGTDSTGLYQNGATPTVPAIDLSMSGIKLLSDDTMDVQLTYNGTVLSMSITDIVTGASYSTSWTVNIPSIVGGNTSYVGFTGGTGTGSSSQKMLTWVYTTGSSPSPISTSPAFMPPGGTYTGAQSVSIANGTSGSTIFYTTNRTVPTTSSTKYTAPIVVSASETLEAIAVTSGYGPSAAAVATYTLTPSVPAPAFSPASGTYTATQTVNISDTMAGATIYYTTNGSTPTVSSTQYTGPISVGATETLQAIAIETGDTNSPVAAATYTISSGSTSYINYPSGGFTASRLSLQGNPTVTSGSLQLTNGGAGENSAVWFATKVPVQSFSTDFTFQQLNATADGMTFAIQNDPKGIWALGDAGGGLGYQGIQNSVAVKFDLYSNAGEGPDSTGLYTVGAAPTMPAVNLSSTGINLRSGDVTHAHMVYDGTNLTMTLTDTATNAAVTEVFPVNIPSIVGGNTAFVGFTGGTGSTTATQNVLSWTYVSQ